MKILQIGIIGGILFFLIFSGLYHLYQTPILVKQNCKYQALYRYHFGIYHLSSSDLIDQTKLIQVDGDIDDDRQLETKVSQNDHPLYGFQHFLGLKPVQCYEQIKYEQCIATVQKSIAAFQQEEKQWKLVRDNLYINSKQQLALKFPYANHCSMDISEDVRVDPQFPISQERFYQHFGFNSEDEPSLTETLDLATFKQISYSFYQDRNHIYRYYDMLGGGSFSIFDADAATFRMIGDCYAKDKNHIYEERSGQLEGVDYATFKSKFDIGCVGKDKKGYWLWGNREVLDPNVQDERILQNIKILDE